jgi:hypothetical protein
MLLMYIPSNSTLCALLNVVMYLGICRIYGPENHNLSETQYVDTICNKSCFYLTITLNSYLYRSIVGHYQYIAPAEMMVKLLDSWKSSNKIKCTMMHGYFIV